MSEPQRLAHHEVRLTVDAQSLGFQTTQDLPDLVAVLGQTRALSALDFAFGVRDSRFHLFVAGPPGTGRSSIAPARAREFAAQRPTPNDWCYVHNFDEPDEPRALPLPPGQGRAFVREMRTLIENLEKNIPNALSSRDYRSHYQTVLEQAHDERRVFLEVLEAKARLIGIGVEDNEQSVHLVPLLEDGKPMSPEQYGDLPEEERRTIEERERTLRDDILEYLDHAKTIQDAAEEKLDKLDRKTISRVLSPAMSRLRKRLNPTPEVEAYLRMVSDSILDSPSWFMPPEQETPFERPRSATEADRYVVNLLLDHSAGDGGPVVEEWHPTHANLIGRIERRMSFGAMETSHTLIRAGALLRASGGVLILSARDLITFPFTYTALKRALRDGVCTIEDPDDGSSTSSSISLRPQPIPFETRVVLIGSLEDYVALKTLDEEFGKLFKVRADFGDVMPRTAESMLQYAQFVATRARSGNLLPFSADGVAAIIEESVREAGRRDELSLRFAELTDYLIEVDHWARLAGKSLITRAEVLDADLRRRERDGMFGEQILQQFQRGTIFVETTGSRIGQVNGLAVLGVGTFDHGLPCRITAKTFAGSQGVVNIERETELSGQIHSKAVLILSGYLGAMYAQDRALALSASITFEQNYSLIEGDSASVAEATALLSSLSDLPLRQDIAVTGSLSQHGEVQPIGGVNEKVEGWFEVCQLGGLTGTQGAIVPASNVPEMQLRPHVAKAIAEGRFHVWAAKSLDEVLHLLTGLTPGKRRRDGTFPERSVHGRVANRVRLMAEKEKGSETP